MRDHYGFWNFWLTIGALVPTAAMLCLVFVTDEFASQSLHLSPTELKLVNAGVALFTFVCVLVQLVWKPDSHEVAHARAAEYFARREIGIARDGDHETFVRSFPPIPSAKETRLKRIHLQREHASRILETDPWAVIP